MLGERKLYFAWNNGVVTILEDKLQGKLCTNNLDQIGFDTTESGANSEIKRRLVESQYCSDLCMLLYCYEKQKLRALMPYLKKRANCFSLLNAILNL